MFMDSKNTSFFKEGTCLFWKNIGKLSLYNLYLFLIALAVFLLFAIITDRAVANTDMVGSQISTSGIVFILLFFAFLILAAPVLGTGYQYIYVKLARKESISFKNIFAGFRHFWPVWLSHFFTQVIGFGGVMLVLIPLLIISIALVINQIAIPVFLLGSYYWLDYLPVGFVVLIVIQIIVVLVFSIYWACKLLFAHIAALDKKVQPSDAIYYANNLSKGNKMKIFLNFFLPYIILIIILNIITYFIGDTGLLAKISAFVISLLNVFIFTPWACSIIAVAYVRISDGFDQNLSSIFLEKFIRPKTSLAEPVNEAEESDKEVDVNEIEAEKTDEETEVED
jgi:hypothetical protein